MFSKINNSCHLSTGKKNKSLIIDQDIYAPTIIQIKLTCFIIYNSLLLGHHRGVDFLNHVKCACEKCEFSASSLIPYHSFLKTNEILCLWCEMILSGSNINHFFLIIFKCQFPDARALSFAHFSKLPVKRDTELSK